MPLIRLFFRTGPLLLLLLGARHLDAQPACYLHLDKDFYVNGEYIWYRLYLPSAFEQAQPLLGVQVLDSTGRVYHRSYLRVRPGRGAAGYYHIPYDIRPGMYRLLITATAPGRTHVLADAVLPVYNDLAIPSDPPLRPEPVQALPPGDMPVLRLAVPPVVPDPRSEVALDVQSSAGRLSGHGSVSVVADGAEVPVLVQGTLPDFVPDTLVRLAGYLTDNGGKPVETGSLGVYRIDARRLGGRTNSDADGYFEVMLEPGVVADQIQFVDYFLPEVKVRLVEAALGQVSQPFYYTARRLAYLEDSRRRKKIYQRFDTWEQPLPPVPDTVAAQVLQPDLSLRPGDYDYFPDLRTFMEEVLTPLTLRHKRDGRVVAKLFNPETDIRAFYPRAPLFIVDGKMTWSAAFVASLDIRNIERIDYHYHFPSLVRQFGFLGVNGLVHFHLKNPADPFPPQDARNIFLLDPIQAPQSFACPEDLPAGVPVFRPVVYWAPDVPVDAQGHMQTRFQTGDDRGDFWVHIVALAADGRLVWGAAPFVQP
ncbi:MAG: hypothetical protein OHK0039_23090 [Bacteroidia bacterium]